MSCVMSNEFYKTVLWCFFCQSACKIQLSFKQLSPKFFPQSNLGPMSCLSKANTWRFIEAGNYALVSSVFHRLLEEFLPVHVHTSCYYPSL